MKKINALMVGLGACALLTLSSCDFLKSLTGTISGEETADDWQGTWTLTQNFFEGTLGDTNQEVKVFRNNTLLRTETIDGDKCHYVLANITDERFSFKDESLRYVATYDDPIHGKLYYLNDKDEYERNFYRYFKDGPGLLEVLENVECTYDCKVVDEGTFSFFSDNNGITQTYTLALTSEGVTYNFSGTAKNGAVQTFSYEQNEAGVKVNYRLDFTYGEASVTPPSLEGYTKLN